MRKNRLQNQKQNEKEHLSNKHSYRVSQLIYHFHLH